MGNKKDLTGKRFGKLTALKDSGERNYGSIIWLCKCDCGNLAKARTNRLIGGVTKSCGCLIGESNKSRALPEGESLLNQLLFIYKNNAKKRDYKWKLSRDEFKQLTQQDCYYCGVEPSQTYERPGYRGSYTYNGVDRKDNNKGYFKKNTVPCCGNCNKAKMDMSYDEFIAMCHEVSHRHKIK